MGVWAYHFSGLCKSRGDGLMGLEELKHRMKMLVSESNRKEEMLDVPFSAEEVSAALGRLKNRKQHGLMA